MNDTTFNRIAHFLKPRRDGGDDRPPAKASVGVAAGVRDWVAERPVICISLAACLGVAIGWWIKRR